MGNWRAKPKSGYLSRRQAAISLRITVAQLKGMHQKGVLEGKYDQNQARWWYSEEHITAARAYLNHAPKRSRGEETAQAIAHFKAGTADIDIMLDMRITRGRLEQLRQDIDPGGWYLDARTLRELRAQLERSGLAARTSAELLESIRLLCQRDLELSRLELSEPA